MTDKAAIAVVDLDAGQGFGTETIPLSRPFKFKGAIYNELKLRVPTGLDLKKHMSRTGRVNGDALMSDLAELSADVLDAMYAGDRNRVDVAIGRHLAGGADA